MVDLSIELSLMSVFILFKYQFLLQTFQKLLRHFQAIVNAFIKYRHDVTVRFFHTAVSFMLYLVSDPSFM